MAEDHDDAPASRSAKPPAAGGETADLSEIAAGLADAAKEQTKSLLDAAKGTATSFADQRKDRAAQTISGIANSIRESGGGFEDQPNIGAFVGSAADGLEQLASSIRDRSFAELYGDVEDFARRQPIAVGAAALLGGFLLARFIKSSADELSSASHAARADAGKPRGRARPTQSHA